MALPQVIPDLSKDKAPSLDWRKNPAAKRLLDALIAILKEEYIQKAKENPELFSK